MRTTIETNRKSEASRTRVEAAVCWIAGLLLGLACTAAVHASIVVTYDGPPDANTCTFAQAINAANDANGVAPASYGSATPAGNCALPAAGPNVIAVYIPTVTLTTIDNYWYGPNALPPIASTIVILAIGQVTTIRAVHTGDPTPATANAFRLFYVSGGMELPAGSLTIFNAVLQGGYAKGGNAFSGGGGGAGMGGAIFNQGSLTLRSVSLIGNTAVGGTNFGGGYGSGGMGQDGGGSGYAGGGFGWPAAPAAYGGNGGGGNPSGCGGGGGFVAGSDGGNGGVGVGGGQGGLGGTTGAVGGDGGQAGGAVFGNGGNFGQGGVSTCGGGGVGGGGSSVGSGGGFGGGGGYSAGPGGFGGGGGGLGSGGGGGFGGGNGDAYDGGGAAGMGGAIFNHAGAVYLLNVTAIGNVVNGGVHATVFGYCVSVCNGSGLGAVLFNLNGNVTIDFSTLAGNFLSGNNSRADNAGPEDGTVYSLAYGNKIQDGTASAATLTIHNSIIRSTQADGGLHSEVSVNVVNGANTNASSLVYVGKNFIGQSYTVTGVTQTGTSPSTTDPLLGSLSLYFGLPGSTNPTPVLPIGSNSPAYDAAPSCLLADGTTTLTRDGRSAVRPYSVQCDVGAYEFDGNYIFADGADVKL